MKRFVNCLNQKLMIAISNKMNIHKGFVQISHASHTLKRWTTNNGNTMKKLLFILSVFLSAQCFSQEILTIREVFDFDIGDEFHYMHDLGTPQRGEYLKILEKNYSADSNKVTYKISRNRYISDVEWEPEPHLVYTYYKDTYSSSYTFLDSSIYYLNPWLQYDTIAKYNGAFDYDSIVEGSSKLCNIPINGFDVSIGDFEPSQWIYIYGQGVGLVRGYYRPGDSGGIVDEDISLIAYRKSNKNCGMQVVDGIKEGINSSIELLIFPNPTSAQLTIQFPDNFPSIWKMEFYNIHGKLLDLQFLEGRSFQYDVSKMDKGVYFLKIYSSNKVLTNKIIIN